MIDLFYPQNWTSLHADSQEREAANSVNHSPKPLRL
jgi:hypothetical protein